MANRANVATSEAFNYLSHTPEAQTYKWTFNQDASIASSTKANVFNVSYATAGQKTLSLITTSAAGCSDTLATNAITVYNKPLTDETCYSAEY